MKHLATTEDEAHAVYVAEDWRLIFEDILKDAAKRSPAAADLDGLSEFIDTASNTALALFVDAHNTGCYINSYTTKVNPTMDNVLRRLLDGLRRLHDEWQPSTATSAGNEAPTKRRRVGKQSESVSCATNVCATQTNGRQSLPKPRQDFKRVMRVFSTFESAFRRASWKSGCELAFSILFGHLSFSTHRYWTVFLRMAIYCAGEAWRQAYGQQALRLEITPEAALTHKLPSGQLLLLDGWRTETRNNNTVYVGPGNQVCDTIQYAVETFTAERKTSGSSQRTALAVLNKLVQHLKEGEREEHAADSASPATSAAEQAGKAHYFTLSQLDDWLHRGPHVLVANMSLYTYSMWVYRVELSQSTTKRPRFIDIPFDDSYPTCHTWVQRLATEPRVPLLQGMQFVTVAEDPEMHYTVSYTHLTLPTIYSV